MPGVVIDGILGIDMNVTDEFMSQMDFPITLDSHSPESKKRVEVSLLHAHWWHDSKGLYIDSKEKRTCNLVPIKIQSGS